MEGITLVRPDNARQPGCRSQDAHDDQWLIQRVLGGHPGAQEEFVVRYRRLIYTILQNMGLSGPDKEDRFQQVFLSLWEDNCRRLRHWQSSKGRFSAFLSVLVVHLVRDHARQSARPAQTMSLTDLDPERIGAPAWTDNGMDPEEIMIRRHRNAAIKEAVGRLTARDAELIHRRYFREESYKEIASGLCITVNNVGVALMRAEKRLGCGLRERYPELCE